MNAVRMVAALWTVVAGLAVMPAAPLLAAEPPGDATRGRAVFEQKQCTRCHQSQGQRGLGPPLEQIKRPQGAFELAGRLWNHAPAMFSLLQQERVEWPQMSAPEMADLMAYLQATPSRDPVPDLFQGQVLLLRKGCLKCHRLRGEGGSVGSELTTFHRGYDSPVAWATSIWNHSPRMSAHAARLGVLYPRFTGDEMVNLLGFLKGSAEVSPR